MKLTKDEKLILIGMLEFKYRETKEKPFNVIKNKIMEDIKNENNKSKKSK